MKTFSVAVVCFFISVGAMADGLPIPKLFFRYSVGYDTVCAGNNPVDPAWATEAYARQQDFAAIWEREAETLFSPILSAFGKGLSRKEMTATLSVCPLAPSFSDPLILNVVSYLKSYMKDRPVRPEYAFADLVFHELLHTWVVENVPPRTPLVEKYRLLEKQNPKLRSLLAHLHLMALQKWTYLQVGRPELLEWISIHYAKMVQPYPRAWEIVNAEGHEAFLAEIPKR